MSGTPSSTPSRPLASLSGSQQNQRATPSLFTPIKSFDDGNDDYEVTSTVKSTITKSSRTMTIHNGEIVESSHQTSRETGHGGDANRHSQEFYDAPEADGVGEDTIDFNPVESSPFETTVATDSHTGAPSVAHSPPKSPSPFKSQPQVFATEDDADESVLHHDLGSSNAREEGMSTIHQSAGDETDMTIDFGDLSTFSAVPNVDMTQFAGLRGASPTKTGGGWSPGKQLNASYLNTPGVSRRSSPQKDSFDDDMTPRRPGTDTTDLLNFTGQSNIFIPPPQSTPRTSRRSPSGRGAFPIRVSPTKSQAQIDRERSQPTPRPSLPEPKSSSGILETPSRGTGFRNNLLDLDLDPLPTPRSVPTITPRELESLRSDLTSQISALRATLSGKEAEVSALKRAITDAEVRCGTALEDVRNEKAKVDGLENERESWGRRQMEMEGILRDVRQEVLVRTRDAEKAERKVDEMEKKSGDWEGKTRELEAQVESLKRRVAAAATASVAGGDDVGDVTMKLMDVDSAVKDATERVARELHGLYKGKHESKVAALKKSYEARWEKKVRDLENALKEAQDDVVALKTERDATFSGVLPNAAAENERVERDEKTREDAEKLEAAKHMLEARISGLESELNSTKEEGVLVRDELEKQRSENGELVAAVDLMLQLQDEVPADSSSSGEDKVITTNPALQSGLESLRGSIQRSSHPHHYSSTSASTPSQKAATSGLKLPQPTRTTGIPTSGSSMGFPSESRIGRAPTANRGLAGRGRSSSGNRVGAGQRGGIMEGIARMGQGTGGR